MKRMSTALLVTFCLVAMPMLGFAMSHEKHEGHEKMMHEEHKSMEKSMQHGDMQHSEHGMHEGHGDHGDEFKVIGEQVEKGVKGVAEVMAYDKEKAAMAGATHHVMFNFSEESTGKNVTGGLAALKVKSGDSTSKPIKLMQMEEGFGADVDLEPGKDYELEVGTKFEDGEKRQFIYHYQVK